MPMVIELALWPGGTQSEFMGAGDVLNGTSMRIDPHYLPA